MISFSSHLMISFSVPSSFTRSTGHQARDFLRCAGWCLPDDDLDAMLLPPAGAGVGAKSGGAEGAEGGA